MNTSLVARAGLQPSTATTNRQVGVDYERVDPSTRRLIQALFPSHTRGCTFIVNLLANAVIKKYTFPGMPREDVAVINVTKGYAELSQLLRLSYDTTHMYVLVYRALGLLYIEEQGEQTTIIFPLRAYQPPARLREILRQLQEHYCDRRPKVRRLINKIIARFMSLIQLEPEQEVSEKLPDQDETLMRVQHVLTSRGVIDPDGQIALCIVTEIAPLFASHGGPSALQVEQGVHVYLPRFYELRSRETTTSQQESSSIEGKNLVEEVPAVSLPSASSEAKGSRTTPRPTAESRESGRFCMPNLSIMLPRGQDELATVKTMTYETACERSDPENLPNGPRTGKAAGKASTRKGRFSAPNLLTNLQAEDPSQADPGLTSMNLPLKGDSETLLSNGNGNGNGDKNRNNISLSHPDPVPVKKPRKRSNENRQLSPMPRRLANAGLISQAKTLAQLIEGSEENLGAYITLVKQHQPQTLRAAVIATLLRKHWPQGKGVLRKPGGYYTRRVQQFQHAIPEPILSLLQTYKQVSYEEIDAALGTQAHMQAARQEPGIPVRQGTIRPKRGIPMSKARAEVLARRIPLEDSSVQVRGLYEEDGIYAVRVYIAPVEHLFASIEDWEYYHAQMQLLEQEESA
jgi:hypothetical protein